MTALPPFRLYLWSHRALYLGLSPDNDLHCHHAAQLCVSLGEPLRYRTESGSCWSSSSGVLIPPHLPHQLDAGNQHILALYWEPESDDYPLTFAAHAVQPFSLTVDECDALRSLTDRQVDADRAWSVCASVLRLNSHRQSILTDARIQTVVERIRSQPHRAYSGQELADLVSLSPSRLRHLFKRHLGVPVRRFIVWSRLRAVIEHALKGFSLTEAAHAAGFSDSPHMSHAFRRMFGFAPSALFSADSPKSVVIVKDRR